MSTERIVFGDSNVCLFWNLGEVVAGWRLDPTRDDEFPKLTLGAGVPTLLAYERTWLADVDGALPLVLVSLPGAMGSGSPARLDPFSRIRGYLANRRRCDLAVYLHFGHNDLDFLPWHGWATKGQEPEAVVAEAARAYLAAIADCVDESMAVTIMGAHPVVVDDDAFFNSLIRHGLGMMRQFDSAAQFLRLCPASRFEARVGARASFNARLRDACTAFGWTYADITPRLVSGGRVREEYRMTEHPWCLKPRLEPLLPIWLEELGIQ